MVLTLEVLFYSRNSSIFCVEKPQGSFSFSGQIVVSAWGGTCDELLYKAGDAKWTKDEV
jgi:hypothetical protein